MNYVFPLKQHVGAPCVPVVEVDAVVKRGSLIAEPNGLGANIFSSVAGRVVSIDDNSITIDADKVQSDEFVPLKSTEPLDLIKEAGIIGAGGAGFPAAVKFATPVPKGTVIVNAAECEPFLKHNIKFAEAHPEMIIRGLQIVMDIVQADQGYIAIKTKNLKAMTALGRACKEIKNITVKALPEMYPAGDERVIIREILGIVLEPGQLPSKANAVVSNVETIKNIVRAVDKKMPCIVKDITVAGRVQNPQVFFDVPIGSPISTYVEQAGGFIEPRGELVLGGPFTGQPGDENRPVVKTLGGVLAAVPFPKETRKFGVIGCECGAGIPRLTQIAEDMGGEVVASTNCKRMVDVNGRLRCDLPGICPGQAEKVLYLKKEGAQVIIAGTCEG